MKNVLMILFFSMYLVVYLTSLLIAAILGVIILLGYVITMTIVGGIRKWVLR